MAADRFRALIVDDDASIRRLIGIALRKIGYECELVADGEQAAKLSAKSRFDVVVTDLKMPNKNGHALALDLLQRENRPLIVVYTGIVEPRLATDLLARGVDDILFKPIDFGVLAAKVKALVERRPAGAAHHAPVDVRAADVPAAVVHELSNLLTVILGYSQMSLESPGDDATARERIEVIHKAAQQASSLVLQLSAMSAAAGSGPPGAPSNSHNPRISA